MPEPMPQEIEVWDILPAIRRELAKALKEQGLSQKGAAEKLGITEAAVSQYLSSKRGHGVTFSKTVTKEIKASAKAITDGASTVHEMHRISNLLDVKKAVCKIHQDKSTNLPKDCRICLQ